MKRSRSFTGGVLVEVDLDWYHRLRDAYIHAARIQGSDIEEIIKGVGRALLGRKKLEEERNGTNNPECERVPRET